GRGPGDLAGVADGRQKDGIVRERDKVTEPNERGGAGPLPPEEAQLHAVEKRVAQEQQQEEKRRREDEPAEHGLPLHEFAEPAESQRPVVTRFERGSPRRLDSSTHRSA